MVRLSLLHPFIGWWCRRRIKGGVPDGMTRQAVLAKLGPPQRQWSDEGYDIWVYHVGQTRKLVVSYSVSFDGDRASASWWSESAPKTPPHA
jgi:hypothetical protein